MNENYNEMDNERLIDECINPNLERTEKAKAVFLSRQTTAIQDTAEHTKRYTKYMFWTMLFTALTAFAAFLTMLFQVISPS
ncbi:hypothetical protein [uncultured Desulfosarcina sp.]|uniref:hypothetical protein n=1 Tax=uncultured Desulfosarcina sp. TaxID=218289 RepID=UPI0029C85186|nr:hypothetical protein [uncultured Desulfosarcina sp.]